MLRPRMRVAILIAFALAIPSAGLLWSLSQGKRNSMVARRGVGEDAPRPEDLKKRLDELRAEIDQLSWKEHLAQVEADNEVAATASNRRQAEHVMRFGVSAHVEYYANASERSAKAAAASRVSAASFGRKRRELEEVYYRLWEFVPPDLWETIRIHRSDR
jgi:hypothetical protein